MEQCIVTLGNDGPYIIVPGSADSLESYDVSPEFAIEVRIQLLQTGVGGACVRVGLDQGVVLLLLSTRAPNTWGSGVPLRGLCGTAWPRDS